MILGILRRIKKHGSDILFRGKKIESFPGGACSNGRYYYHQLTHLNEERGCAITCLAMLFSNYFGKFIPPAKVFRWNLNHVYVHWNVVFFRAGLKWEEILLAGKTKPEKQAIIQETLKTHPEGIIAHFQDSGNDYKHYLMINKAENGLDGVADPMGDESTIENGQSFGIQTGDIRFEQSFTYRKFGREESWSFLQRIMMIRHGSHHGV